MNGGELLLAQSGGGAGSLLGFLLPFAALLLLMYALVIRPQQRQQRDHRTMLSQIQRGDQVVTTGGLHGKVTGVADDVLTVEIAERVRVKISKSAVASRAPGDKEKS
jgi:preprotein translocase subunit YajC